MHQRAFGNPVPGRADPEREYGVAGRKAPVLIYSSRAVDGYDPVPGPEGVGDRIAPASHVGPEVLMHGGTVRTLIALMAAQQVDIAVRGGMSVHICNAIGTGGNCTLALVYSRIEIRCVVAEQSQAHRLQEACAYLVRVAVNFSFSGVFNLPIAHVVPVVVIVVHRCGKIPVDAK